jgi:hypothetical protein
LAAFGAVFGRYARGGWSGLQVTGRPLSSRIGAQSSDGTEEYPTMTNRADADFLQVLLGEFREDPLVHLTVAESRLVFFQAKAPQLDHYVHDGAPTHGCRIMVLARKGV